MTRRAIEPTAIHTAAFQMHDAGPSPKMEWISISALVVDDEYQRDISSRGHKTIATIARAFTWSKFSPVIVTPVDGGKYAIIDGQHRSTAAAACRYERVPCYIVKADPREAAAIFAAVNGTVTPLQPLALYKGALVAGVEWAVAMKRACSAAGITPLTFPKSRANMKPGETQAIGTLRNAIDRFGEAAVAATLKLLMAFDDMHEPGAILSAPIRRLLPLFSTWPERVKQADAIAARAKGRILGLASDARLAEIARGGMADGAAGRDVKVAVLDLANRRHAPAQIAAMLRIPYKQVEQIMGEDR